MSDYMKAWKIGASLAIVALACLTAYLLLEKPMCPIVENNTIEMYNRGYVQGINDMVIEAYRTGVVKIPFNETHYVALMPFSGD